MGRMALVPVSGRPQGRAGAQGSPAPAGSAAPLPSLGKIRWARAITPASSTSRNPPRFSSTGGWGVERWRHTTGKKQSKPRRAEGSELPTPPALKATREASCHLPSPPCGARGGPAVSSQPGIGRTRMRRNQRPDYTDHESAGSNPSCRPTNAQTAACSPFQRNPDAESPESSWVGQRGGALTAARTSWHRNCSLVSSRTWTFPPGTPDPTATSSLYPCRAPLRQGPGQVGTRRALTGTSVQLGRV